MLSINIAQQLQCTQAHFLNDDKQVALWIDSHEPILVTSIETLLVRYSWLPHEVANKIFLYLHIRLQDENKLSKEREKQQML